MFVGRDDNVTLSQERERERDYYYNRERDITTQREIVITTEREILQQMKKNCAVK